MAKQKGKKNNSSPNKARARAKAEIEARQAAKKAAKKAELKAKGIDPDRKKVRHNHKHRKAAPSYNDSATTSNDIVYTINDGNVVVDGSEDVALVTDGGVRRWTMMA